MYVGVLVQTLYGTFFVKKKMLSNSITIQLYNIADEHLGYCLSQNLYFNFAMSFQMVLKRC
jgi:hypothetical protein